MKQLKYNEYDEIKKKPGITYRPVVHKLNGVNIREFIEVLYRGQSVCKIEVCQYDSGWVYRHWPVKYPGQYVTSHHIYSDHVSAWIEGLEQAVFYPFIPYTTSLK